MPPRSRTRYLVFLGGLFAYACIPAQAPERPACADEALAAILLECRAEIAAAPNATEKAHVRKACLARVDAWEACQ